MSKKEFPDYRTMDIFEEALRNLIGTSQHYVDEISPLTEMGDIQIFCQIISTTFINGLLDYIGSLRRENNDPPEYGLDCYKQCVDIMVKSLREPMILNVFKNPPEDWMEKCIGKS